MGLRIALFGQAAFGRDVVAGLADAGHQIVGVYAPPEGARPDPLAEEADQRGLPLFRHKRFRRRGEAIPELVDAYRKLDAELNLLAFVTVILPPEIIDAPPHGSLCFHPSLLPRFRGGNALAWQIIEGERETGVTVFRPDAGVDTGPIVVQRGGVEIRDSDTAGTLYFERLYPLGVEAMIEAAGAVDRGDARYEPQDESRATHQGLVADEDARIDWAADAQAIDRRIRGCDPQPGAFAIRDGERVRLFGGQLLDTADAGPPGAVVAVDAGRLTIAARGGRISVARVRIGDGAKLPAADAGLAPGDQLS